jgi:hypothetical protein
VSETPFYPFIPRRNRPPITKEPDAAGRWTPVFPDMIGYEQLGGGAVPGDFTWHSNPKQWQEEMTDDGLRAEARAHHALEEAVLPAALPPGPKE